SRISVDRNHAMRSECRFVIMPDRLPGNSWHLRLAAMLRTSKTWNDDLQVGLKAPHRRTMALQYEGDFPLFTERGSRQSVAMRRAGTSRTRFRALAVKAYAPFSRRSMR